MSLEVANLLYLTHRLPYPPDKGDKVRSYHVLKHLAANHRVFLGTFIDDPHDEQHVDALSEICADVYVARLRPRLARPASLMAFSDGQSLTTRYYRNPGLRRWVTSIFESRKVDAAIAFSSAMAQYVPRSGGVPLLVDFVDVDSEKWSQYAGTRAWPLSWLYKRESTLLLAFERETAARSDFSFFVTQAETDLFGRLAPECASRVGTLCNGVDSDFFVPDPTGASPFAPGPQATGSSIVFTGAMDYWPNIDAVNWFARSVMPQLRARVPEVRFHIVGRNAPASVRALQSPTVEVTGTVADVRPYLQHAAVVVAPLRVARGVQNKILEGMSMGRPVVASSACAAAIDAAPGTELLTATTAAEFAARVESLLRNPEYAEAVGRAARECVMRNYSWDTNLARLDSAITALPRLGLVA